MTWNLKYELEALINNLGKLLLHALQTLWKKVYYIWNMQTVYGRQN